MDAKHGFMLAGALIYGGTTLGAASFKEMQAKLSDTNRMLQVVFATSSQSFNSNGVHAVGFPGMGTYTSPVPQLCEHLVVKNGAAFNPAFTNVSSRGVV